MTSSKRKRLFCFCAVFCQLFLLSLVSADDVTTDSPRSRNTTSVRRSIHPHAMTIRSDVIHRYATTTVTQKFTNDQPTGNSMTAVFRFLIPKSAVVTNFTASVDGRQFHAERQQQQQQEETAAVAGGVNADKATVAATAAAETSRGGRDGVGVEAIRGRSAIKTISQLRQAARQFTDRSVFQAEVELSPGGKVDFHLSFEELLVRRLGVYDLSFILGQSQGQGHGPIRDLRVDVRVKETSDISFLRVFPPPGQLDSPVTSLFNGTEEGHQQLRIRRTSSGAAHVTYTPTVADQSQWIAAMTSPDDVRVFSVRYDVRHQLDAGEIQIKDSHFVHHFSPSGLQTIDKNIVFIIDFSSSSGGGESSSKMSDIRTALINILDELRPSDMFNVIAYSSILRYWNTDSVVPASPANIGSAKTFVAGLQRVNSGSNINDALLRAVDFLIKQEESDPLATRVSSFLLVADSAPSTGIIDPDRILANVRQAAGGRVSSFAFGLRPDVGRPFLDRLGQQNRGAARRCSGSCSGRALVDQIRAFYRELASPLLENVRVRYDESVDESSLTDVDFPAYIDGSELVIAGRLTDRNVQGSSGSGHMSAKVSGGSAQGYMSLDTKLKTPRSDRAGHRRSGAHSTNGNVVEKIWAWLTTQRLLRKAHDTGNETVRVATLASIQQLATQYSFATSMTSLIMRDVIQPNSTINVAFYNSDDELLKTASDEQVLINRRRPPLINSKQRDQSDSHRAFVDNDPHFLVTVNGLSKAVCFDVDGHPGTVYQLLHDKLTNVSVNALVIAARGRQPDSSAHHHHPTKTRTYLGKIAVLAGPNCTVIIDPHNIYIDLQAFPWSQNASLSCSAGGATPAVQVDVISGHHVTVAMGTDIVVRVLRHVVGPSHPFKVDFLGFYIERSEGLSQDTHGLIGQFIHQRAQQVRSSLRYHDNDDNDSLRLVSKLTFVGPHTPRRTIRAVLAERRDMEVKQRIPCWHVARNGKGLIQGTPESYSVQHLLQRQSSFETFNVRH